MASKNHNLGIDLRFSSFEGKLDIISADMKSIKESMTLFNENYEKTRVEMAEIKEDHKKLKIENDVLRGHILELRKELESLKKMADSAIRPAYSSGFELSPVAYSKNENLLNLVKKIAVDAKSNVKEQEIKGVFRRKPNRKGEPGVVVVRLISENVRNEFMKAIKERIVKQSDIGFPGDARRVYVKEELTPYARDLYFKSLELKKRLNFRFLWIKDGKVFLRKKENERYHLISCISDLQALDTNQAA